MYTNNLYTYESANVTADFYPSDDPQWDDEITAVANALEEIIAQLAKDDQKLSAYDISLALGDAHAELQASLALTAAVRWNLIEVAASKEAGTGDEADATLFQITDAGKVWNIASPNYHPPAATSQRRRVGASRKKSQPSVTYFFGSVGAVFQDSEVSGQQTINQGRVAEHEYLAGLLKLLAAPGITWGEPQLADDRKVIEQATAQKSARIPGLQEAVRRVLATCGTAALHAIGDDTYHMLTHIRV